jgi:hypothetical protein
VALLVEVAQTVTNCVAKEVGGGAILRMYSNSPIQNLCGVLNEAVLCSLTINFPCTFKSHYSPLV